MNQYSWLQGIKFVLQPEIVETHPKKTSHSPEYPQFEGNLL